MDREYVIYISEYGKAPEPLAQFKKQLEARRTMEHLAARAGYRKAGKDLWSKKEHKIFLKTFYPESKP